MRAFRIAVAAVALAAAACSSAAIVAPTSGPTAVPTGSPSPTARPTPTAPPALVGNWLGIHNCQRIVDMLHAAGLDQQVPLNVYELTPGYDDPADVDPADPCKGAIELRHSHFFTSRGLFGSRDQNGQQVDDNSWSIIDENTFAIADTEFRYRVSGDELTMEPVSVGSCPADPNTWCPEAWKLMVAMPGMVWTRG